ncbi:MAG: FtsW/RodA/SpoVE family cell cycle protein, partial [Chloroflexota bacterium]
MSQTVKYPSYRHEKIELFLVGIAILFVLVNALILSLTQEGSVISQVIYPAIIWTLAIGAVYLFLERRLPQRDRLIYPIAAFTTGWGVLLVQRLAPAFVWRQLLWAVLGSVSLAVVSVMFPERTGDPGGLRFLRRFRHTWLILGLVLLATTFIFGVNPSGEGLRLWLGGNVPFLGKVYVQPSEILKILTVVFLASYMAERHELVPNRHFKIGRFRIALLPTSYVAPLLFSWGISVVLLILQRDLGAAMLFILTFLAMLYLAGGSWEAVVIGFTMMIATIAIAYLIPVPQLDVVRLRLDTWINPWIDSSGRGFQIVQSLIAVSSGGIIGEGIG